MSERRILVIGSQCDQLGRLSFLPQAAQDLYAVMTDPNLGGCVSALESSGLLCDPSVAEAKRAIKAAFERASQDEATLFLAFIGHGEYAGEDFYLLVKDASVPPDSESAIHLVQRIKELHGRHSNVVGLVVLLDACFSGMAAMAAAAHWVTDLKGTLQFEVLTAAADRAAADGCFSKSLAHALRKGLTNVQHEYVRCEKVKPVIERLCPKQQPQHPTWSADEGLYLAKNAAARKRPWVSTKAGVEVERLLTWFQPTPQLEELAGAAQQNRCTALTGVAGSGKSALAAALACPEVTQCMVPEDFVQAVAFLSEATTPQELATELAKQLQDAVPEFALAQAAFLSRLRPEQLVRLDSLQRDVLGPLKALPANLSLRIVVDGLDRLSVGAKEPVRAALEVLAVDPALASVRLIVTSQLAAPLPGAPKLLEMGCTDDDSIRAYLARRGGISSALHERIVHKAAGNWLIARLLADLALKVPSAEEDVLPGDLVGIYDAVLRQAGADDRARWQKELRPMLGVLAAAGVGPVLPFKLLRSASQNLGGPARLAKVRDVLANLKGFVARGRPGTDEEQVGLFHQTFAEYLLNPETSEFGMEPAAPHEALLSALAVLAPVEQHDARDPLYRYAASTEAEHWWALGKHHDALLSLRLRASAVPAENLSRWKGWFKRIEGAFGPDHPDTLSTRHSIAFWTGKCGEPAEALRLFQALLPDRQRVLDPDDRDTLSTRHNIAFWTGECGKPAEALRLFQALLPDRQRVLGADDPDTLLTRHNIAFYTGECGEPAEALRLLQELLLDQQRVLGPDDRDTLRTRHNIAFYIDKCGKPAEALRLFQALLPDRQRVLGPDHPDTLRTRSNIASCTDQCGEPAEALRLFQALLADQQRVLGPDHPDTLRTRSNIASRTDQCGEPAEALRLFQALLADQQRVLGPDHPDTLRTRQKIAYLKDRLQQKG
jgi:tetratricopeptide (TPR) repeat protein